MEQQKIADGSGKLAEGGATLTAGIESLQIGTTDLGQGLSKRKQSIKISINRVKKCRNISGTLKSFKDR